jgi:hypothetical protein
MESTMHSTSKDVGYKKKFCIEWCIAKQGIYASVVEMTTQMQWKFEMKKERKNLKFGLEMQLTLDVVGKDARKRPKVYIRFWSPKQGL